MFWEFHEFHGTMFVLFMISNLDTPHTPLIILYVCFFFFSIRWCQNILYKTGISSFLIYHPEIASNFPGTAKIYDRFIYVWRFSIVLDKWCPTNLLRFRWPSFGALFHSSRYNKLMWLKLNECVPGGPVGQTEAEDVQVPSALHVEFKVIDLFQWHV